MPDDAGPDEPAPVVLRREGVVQRVVLNRPTRANAIDEEFAHAFESAVSAAESAEDAQLLLIEAAGPIFCAGGDLKAVVAAPDPGGYLLGIARSFGRGVEQLVSSRLLVVAAVQGAVAGAGNAVALAADIVLASSAATFRFGYGAVGLTPDCGVSVLLPRTVGRARAAQFAHGGRALSAQEAHQWGWATEVYPPADFAASAEQFVAAIVSGATQSIGPTKRLLNQSMAHELHTAIEQEAQLIASMAERADTRNLLERFVSR